MNDVTEKDKGHATQVTHDRDNPNSPIHFPVGNPNVPSPGPMNWPQEVQFSDGTKATILVKAGIASHPGERVFVSVNGTRRFVMTHPSLLAVEVTEEGS